jgi:hypothetical protein
METYTRTRRTPPPPSTPGPVPYTGTGTSLCDCRGYVLASYRNGDLAELTLHHSHHGIWPCRGKIVALDLHDPVWNPPPRPAGTPDPHQQKPKERAERDDPRPSREFTSPRADLTADGRRRR